MHFGCAGGGPSPRTGEGDQPVAPTETRPRTSGMAVGLGLGSGVWVCICSVCWVLGRRWKVRDSDAGPLWHLRRRLWHRRLSCLSLHACLGRLAAVEGVSAWGHPLSASALDRWAGRHIGSKSAVGGRGRIRALRPCKTSRKTRGIPRRGLSRRGVYARVRGVVSARASIERPDAA